MNESLSFATIAVACFSVGFNIGSGIEPPAVPIVRLEWAQPVGEPTPAKPTLTPTRPAYSLAVVGGSRL